MSMLPKSKARGEQLRFINANVASRDPSGISHGNLAGFHPLLNINNLASVQFYGSKDRLITWYYETRDDQGCYNPLNRKYPTPEQ